jgi:hypothetical protein
MNPIIFSILSLLLGIYGFIHYRYYGDEKKGKGYIEVTGTVIKEENYRPPKVYGINTTGGFDKTVKFTFQGKEHVATVYSTGKPDPGDIGKQTAILVNSNDLTDAISASFSGQKMGGMALMAGGIIGCAIFGYLTYKRFK